MTEPNENKRRRICLIYTDSDSYRCLCAARATSRAETIRRKWASRRRGRNFICSATAPDVSRTCRNAGTCGSNRGHVRQFSCCADTRSTTGTMSIRCLEQIQRASSFPCPPHVEAENCDPREDGMSFPWKTAACLLCGVSQHGLLACPIATPTRVPISCRRHVALFAPPHAVGAL